MSQRFVRAPDGTMVAAGMALAPFTLDQACSLNAYQRAGMFHPYTCGADSTHPPLVAVVDAGWVCETCGYTQNYALTWMADWSWQRMGGLPC